MDELRERIARQAEAKRKYDNARQLVRSLREQLAKAERLEENAGAELQTAVTMTCFVAGSAAEGQPEPQDLVLALRTRLRSRLETCGCTLNTCEDCRSDIGALERAGLS